jgi:hypothetical protein
MEHAMPAPVPVFLLDSNEKFKPLDVTSVEDAKLKGRIVDARGKPICPRTAGG